MINHKELIDKQLNCMLHYAKQCSATNLIMDILTIQVGHIRDQVDEAINDCTIQCENAIATTNALFDQRKLAQDEIDQAIIDNVRLYLHTSCIGGMSTEHASNAEAVITDMVRLGIFADLFIRFKNS
jgi:hypothetical protein